MSHHTRRSFVKLSGAVLGGIAAGTTVTAATASDRYLVDTRGNVDLSGVEVVHDLRAVDLAVVRGEREAVEGTSFAPDLTMALDDPVHREAAEPASAVDEPLYGLQWDKRDQNLAAVHEVTRGDGARVAVIDSGVLETHPDLAGPLNVDLSRNFTDDGGDHNPVGDDHGTHVAGTIAADDTNGVGVTGTAPGAELVDCRVFAAEGGAAFGDILAAVVYSAEVGCDAANLSLGAYPVPRGANGEFYGKVLNRTMTHANRQGTLIVAAAGNDGADLQHDGSVISLPNEGAQGFSVAATGPIGFGWGEDGLESPTHSPAYYTNYGTNAIDVAAPGGDVDRDATGSDQPWFNDLVLSTTFSDDADGLTPSYGWKAGTSMAAPQVAGAAALVKSVNPDYSANQVDAALRRTASVPDGYDRAYYGAGYLDPLAAVRD
ncbi:S8 family peptidase [Halostella litorea]|uniref:S8 family peptidase n=1 Tax=Halostella litorea TaxID=2528831 RepID=UPI001091E1C3|nr:S8 family serine peptidase [Halostella litorea]